MNNHEPTPRPEATSSIIDLLQQLIRAHYAQAAQSADTDGEVHQAVADVLMRAHPRRESGRHDEHASPDIAVEIESSLTTALRSMTPTTPEYKAIDLVRRQIRSMRS